MDAGTSSPAEEVCADREAVSPENPDCAWCRRYGVNLDRGGALCRRCRNHPEFRFDLETFALARAARACPGDFAYCRRFGVAAGAEVCGRCRDDPGYRAFLAGQRAARPAARAPGADCPHRGRPLRTEPRRCCGGRFVEVTIHLCARRGEAAPETCAECGG